jgi:Mg2+-importing ATPase
VVVSPSAGSANASPPALGLSAAEAARRLERDGPNEPSHPHERSWALALLRRFANPLVAILVLASVAAAILRDFGNAAVILAIVTISMLVELVQTHRSDHAARALQAKVAASATVLRNGVWREIPRRDVVEGDLVRLTAGDMVPADARIVEARDLHLNEAALTGESLPAEKSANASIALGSSVVSGIATALVTATGRRTSLGAIAGSLATHAGPTEFERGVVRFGALIGKTVFFLVLFVIVATVARRREPLEGLLFALALAVGLTPEFLPMITTVTLTRGAVRMAKAKVIVKNLAAIQNFGSIDILCSDKTGTLTTGEMTLEAHVDPFGASSERPLLLAYVNSFFESGIENPLDAALREKGNLEARRRVDPLDVAVLRHAHPDIHGFEKVDEIPFDFERRRVSVVVRRDAETMLVTKGAPEHVIDVATAYEERGTIAVLDDASRAGCRAAFEALMTRGFRVLGVAWRSLERGRPYDKRDETGLVLAGFLAFADPPREDARDVVASLRREGVHVKVLTGDSEVIARDVCARVGLPTNHVLTGHDIDAMTDPALAHRAERAQVFARVTPAQKGRILRALRTRGHVVGFLGDGINDAPSLHAADVGNLRRQCDGRREGSCFRHLAGAGARCAPRRRPRRTPRVRQRHEVPPHGDELELRQHVQHGRIRGLLAVPADAARRDPAQQLPLRTSRQLTIPYDNVDPHFVRKPRRWNIDLIRRFMFSSGRSARLTTF